MTPKDNRIAELEKQVQELYDSEWGEYYEPLNRLYREVKKALPDWRKRISESEDLAEDDIINLLMDKDAEVRLGLAYILVQMVLEIEGKNDIGGMR